MGFDLNDYEPVADRLARFWTDHPTGRINTIIDRMVDGAVVFRAEIYLDRTDPVPAATGYAEERRSAKGVNETSHIENCETSAVGRALANLGYAPKAARPSREEMAKVERSTSDNDRAARPASGAPRGSLFHDLQTVADRAGLSAEQRKTRLRAKFGREHLHQLTTDELAQVRDIWSAGSDQIQRQEAMADATGT